MEGMDSDARRNDKTGRDGKPMTWGGYDTQDSCKRCVVISFPILQYHALSYHHRGNARARIYH